MSFWLSTPEIDRGEGVIFHIWLVRIKTLSTMKLPWVHTLLDCSRSQSELG